MVVVDKTYKLAFSIIYAYYKYLLHLCTMPQYTKNIGFNKHLKFFCMNGLMNEQSK